MNAVVVYGRPQTGSGGTASSTFTRSTSSPLAGTGGSFLWSKGAVNSMGEGYAYDFTIDSAYQGQQLSVNTLFKVVTGTYATADMTWFIVDRTNGGRVALSASSLMASGIAGPIQPMVWQSASNSVAYRLCCHVSSPSLAAYSLGFDNFSVGPQVVPVGAAMTDWTSYTPSFGGVGTPTNVNFKWRRSGDSLYVEGRADAGTLTAATFTVSMPPGLTADPSKMAPGGITVGVIATTSLSANLNTQVLTNGGASVLFAGVRQGTSGAQFSYANSGVFLSNGDTFTLTTGPIPITGWSSNVLSSDSAASRAVTAGYRWTSNQAVSASSVAICAPQTVITDTHGMYSAGTFTVKVPGTYRINFLGYFGLGESFTSANNTLNNALYIDGTRFQYINIFQPSSTAATNYSTVTGAITVPLNAGQTFNVRVENTDGNTHTLTGGNISVEMIQGPAQIQAATTVAARYTAAGGQSIASSSYTIIDYSQKTHDTTGSVTTGAAWKFVAPAPGIYQVAATSTFTAFNSGGASSVLLVIYKNGTAYAQGSILTTQNVAQNWAASVADQVQMNTGDYIDLRVFQNTGSAQTIVSNPSACSFSVLRVGGIN